MSSIVVVQARTSSSRLPAKVLLPICGMPSIVLCAKRAANTGRRVIVATSIDNSDDVLCDVLSKYQIPFFRGDLSDVLGRFVQCLTSFSDDTLVFRLTGDNLFPDGMLLDTMEKEFIERKLEYLGCNGAPSGLPYGVSAEMTHLSSLREASLAARDEYDREHVTPFIKRKYGSAVMQSLKHVDAGAYRATIDIFEDYIDVERAFRPLSDPVNASLLSLIENLKHSPHQPLSGSVISKFILGTAQLGMAYGIANQSGQPSKSHAREIIRLAVENNASYLDTARAYGESELVIGNSLVGGWSSRIKIVTKLSPLTDCAENTSPAYISAAVKNSVYESLSNLRVESLDVLMLHRASHLTEWSGLVTKQLIKFRESKLINKIGVSVQNPDELMMALDIPEIQYIQMPYNILDWRWNSSIEKIIKIKSERELEVHVRSSLLQGLLNSKDLKLWQRANVTEPSKVIDWLISKVDELKTSSVVELCINYVRSQAWVDGIVIGVERVEQLKQNLKFFGRCMFSAAELAKISATRPVLTENTLNPSLWKVVE